MHTHYQVLGVADNATAEESEHYILHIEGHH